MRFMTAVVTMEVRGMIDPDTGTFFTMERAKEVAEHHDEDVDFWSIECAGDAAFKSWWASTEADERAIALARADCPGDWYSQ